MSLSDRVAQKYLGIYRDTNTRKTKQIVMLYDSAIKYMGLAKRAILEKDIESRFNYTEKTSKIIEGLQVCLDHDKGGEVSDLLSDFYSVVYMRILNINFNNDAESCDGIIAELRKMRDAWAEVDNKTTEILNKESGIQSNSRDINKDDKDPPGGSAVGVSA
jgi:flagellar biosynthetic protein FliS